MFRRLTVSLLTVALLGALLPICSPARAADEWTEDTNSTAAPATAQPPAPTSANAPAAAPAANAPSATHAVPTQEQLRAMLADGKFADAESGYVEHANAWGSDDPALFAEIERQLLGKASGAGDQSALLGLIQAGDSAALETLRSALHTNAAHLSSAQLVTDIRALGLCGNSTDLPLLTKFAQSANPAVLDAVTDAISNLHDRDGFLTLRDIAPEVDATRLIRVGNAMLNIGGYTQLRQRYLLQLTSTLAGVPERSALMLAVAGDDSGWQYIQLMLVNKSRTYYPAVLRVLGTLSGHDTKAYLQAALSGTDEEKIAALQSISLLPAEEVTTKINGLLASTNAPRVRVAALDKLAALQLPSAVGTLRRTAVALTGDSATVRVAAIAALAQYGYLSDDAARATVRNLLLDKDPQVVMAARVALLGYAVKASK
jgi:hypothetical protein